MDSIGNNDLNHILHHTRSVWRDLVNKTIFLTGGTGFFGKWLLESFIYINEELKLGSRLIILSRNPEAFLSEYTFYKKCSNLAFVKGDITDFSFPKEKIDYIIHAATDAKADLNEDQPELMLDTIISGTRRVLDLGREQQVSSLLFISSGAVYGKQLEHITHIKENDSFFIDINSPISAYAEGKRVAELYCSIFCERHLVPIKIARCFAFVGPYLPLERHFAIGNFISNAVRNENIYIKGDGTPLRSYLYAADLTIWLWTILLKGKENQPYNVGSDKSYSIKEVAELVQKTNPHIEIIVQGKPDTAKPIEKYVPNIDLAKKELGLDVYTDLMDSIVKTTSFYKSKMSVLNI